MKFFKILLIPAFLFLLNTSYAQGIVWKKGYVVLTNGDTMRGEVRVNTKKEQEMRTRVTVRKSEDEKKSFNPIKAKEYVFEDTKYVSRMVDGENTFVKCISMGAINLYEHLYEWQSGNDIVYKPEFYLEKANSTEFVKVKSGKFKKIVEEYMADNTELVQEVRDKKYDFDQFAEVVQQYNAWFKTQKG
jgi:hypothetical protein